MRILVTGAAGFIGSELSKFLINSNHEVIMLDNLSYGYIDNLSFNSNFSCEFLCKDIRDPNLYSTFKEKHIDVIVHLAGISSLPECQTHPQEAYSVNLSGTSNILELARKLNVKRVIFASTSAVYENCSTFGGGFREADWLPPPDLIYSCTKFFSEELCKTYSRNYNQDIVICRFFNVFGPHQDIRRKSPPFTSYIAKELFFNRSPIIYNNTDSRRDYIYISDLVEVLNKIINNNNNYYSDIFNIGTGTGYSVKEIYSEFLQASNKQIPATFKDPIRYWDNYQELFLGKHALSKDRVIKEVYKHSIADPEKTKTEFSWQPKVDLRQGITEVYQYTQDMFSHKRNNAES